MPRPEKSLRLPTRESYPRVLLLHLRYWRGVSGILAEKIAVYLTERYVILQALKGQVHLHQVAISA